MAFNVAHSICRINSYSFLMGSMFQSLKIWVPLRLEKGAIVCGVALYKILVRVGLL